MTDRVSEATRQRFERTPLGEAGASPPLPEASGGLGDDAPPPPLRPRARRLTPRSAAGGVGAAALVGLVIFAMLFQWNWLRGPLAQAISIRLHRPVAITGNLEVHPWSWSPRATVNGLVIGNPPWAGRGTMATLARLTVQVRLVPLLEGRVLLPLVSIEHPQVSLIRDAAGRANWARDRSGSGGAPWRLPPIGRLVVTGGQLRYRDDARRIAFAGSLSSDEGSVMPGGGHSVVDGALTVGAASWAGPAPTARVPRLLVVLKALPLLTRGKLVLPLVEADHADVRLLRDAAGRESWSVAGETQRPFKAPVIDRLVISDGNFRFDDLTRDLHAVGVLSSSETVSEVDRGTFRVDARGRLDQTPFVAWVKGGPLLNVDPDRPYPFDARLDSGLTRARLSGSVARPFDLAVISGRLLVTGPDIGELSRLTGLALPRTPPYRLAAGFARDGASYALRDIQGQVGSSDLAGWLAVREDGGRPFLRADLASRRLRLVDLAAVVGVVPPNPRGEPLSPTQKVVAARLRAEHRLLPDERLDISRARIMDASVTYRAQSVEAGRFPVRGLVMKVTLDHGVISANPLDLTLPQGRLGGAVRIDGRGAVPNTSIDLRLTNARLETLAGPAAANPPLEGGLFAHVRVQGAGDSVRVAASNLAGTMTVAIPGGRIRQTIAELLSIDVAKALYLWLSKNQSDTPIRCGIADFQARDGVLTVQRMVLDTGSVVVTGKGDLDLRDETIGLRLQGDPKGFRLLRLHAPITLTGNLQSPKVGVDVIKAAPQLLASVAVGALAGPAAAILPFLHAGRPKDQDCASLMAQAAGAGTPLASR